VGIPADSEGDEGVVKAERTGTVQYVQIEVADEQQDPNWLNMVKQEEQDLNEEMITS